MSDSDRTIDSDELEEIIQRLSNSPHSGENTNVNRLCVDNGNKNVAVSKSSKFPRRALKFHEISDTESSDDNSESSIKDKTSGKKSNFPVGVKDELKTLSPKSLKQKSNVIYSHADQKISVHSNFDEKSSKSPSKHIQKPGMSPMLSKGDTQILSNKNVKKTQDVFSGIKNEGSKSLPGKSVKRKIGEFFERSEDSSRSLSPKQISKNRDIFSERSEDISQAIQSKKARHELSLISETSRNSSTLSSEQRQINSSKSLGENSGATSKNKAIQKPDLHDHKKQIRESTGSKSLCRYGSECYRKNPEHLEQFYHPSDNENLKASGSSDNKVDKVKKSPSSHALSSQNQISILGFYLTKVTGIDARFNNASTRDIKDILSPSHGKLKASAQFNYMIDIEWLMSQYPKEFRSCPLLIVHGEQRDAKKRLEMSGASYPNISFCQAKLEILYGTHHTKMMLLLYEKGLRVVIHTSNLVAGDWYQKTQGMWISPVFPLMKEGPSLIAGESPTKFKKDLVEYLTAYGSKPLLEWCEHIKAHDLSEARVHIIGSTPGRHVDSRKSAFGHLKLKKVLSGSGPDNKLVTNQWPVIGQFSSIGSLGNNEDQWLCGEFLSSLATIKGIGFSGKGVSLKLVYPSVDNVRLSLEGYPAGASLPYSYKVAVKQPYLRNFLHQWVSEIRGRSQASPHIKTYMRISPDTKLCSWFLVTSANLSKAAWGSLEKKGSQLMIRSYELGVLFLPQNFGSYDYFSINSENSSKTLPFLLPYDVPLTPYTSSDHPWTWDIPHVHAPDRNGNKWCPTLR